MDIGKVEDGPVLADEASRLDTVRVLHQTVVALRLALERSRAELNSLRRQLKTTPVYASTIENLAVENHVLRQKVLSSSGFERVNVDKILADMSLRKDNDSVDSDVFEPEDTKSPAEVNCVVGPHEKEAKKDESEARPVSVSSLGPHTRDTPRISKGDSDESEEVDDIELIFTTDDTKEISTFQEDLVSIAENESWQSKSLKEEDISANLLHARSHSVLVETDISKCGVIDENEPPNRGVRRNTLPAPLPYRPIIHRELLTGSRSQIPEGKPVVKFSESPETRSPRGVRPILVEKNSPKQESGAQTDITALPLHWKSESYLAHHRISHNFTTLPSKFALPFGQCSQRRQSLRLSEKTQEARRVLLSDINFTSMVPELSRSADHLCQENNGLLCKYPRAFSYMKNPDGGPISPGFLKWSPCDCMNRQSSWDCYQGSSTSMNPSALDVSDTRRRHSMRPSMDAYWNSIPQKPNWASVPSSPTHFHRSKSVPFSACYIRSTTPQSDGFGGQQSSSRLQSHRHDKFYSSYTLKGFKSQTQKNKVKFQDMKLGGCYPGQSLPDLRMPHDIDEDSTDSLIDESEDYLRRSIDSMLSGSDPTHVTRRRSNSEYNSGDTGGVMPPKRAQPFLARGPSDLRADYWVKVIADEGKVVVGKVRYVGPLPGRPDHHIGIQLSQPHGNTDGTFANRHFFHCEENYGIFVPFKKVIMAWSV